MIHYERNIIGRDFIVGDLHGEYDLLMQKLQDLSFNRFRDRLFSVGDLVDRGPDSLKCLKLIKEDWFISVKGNHESMMFNSVLNDYATDLWVLNGGGWHYEHDPTALYDLCEEAKEILPLRISVDSHNGKIGICHAQPHHEDWDAPFHLKDGESILWGRQWIRLKNPQVIGVYKTVHGHTPVKQVFRTGNLVFIDTGAFYTENLTILPLKDL